MSTLREAFEAGYRAALIPNGPPAGLVRGADEAFKRWQAATPARDGVRFSTQLPPQWTCPTCAYSEYKTHPEWERRFADHVDTHRLDLDPPSTTYGDD